MVCVNREDAIPKCNPFTIFTDSSRLLRRFSSLSIESISGTANPLIPATIKPICLKKIESLPWNFAAFPRVAEITPPAVNKRLNIEDPLIRNEVTDPTNIGSGGNILDKIFDKDLELPATVNNQIGDEGIQAAVMIGIRRRKMKKHKLKKLRHKMKFEWAKVRLQLVLLFIFKLFACRYDNAENYVKKKPFRLC